MFSLILDVREVLRTNGVPIRPRAACGAASVCNGQDRGPSSATGTDGSAP